MMPATIHLVFFLLFIIFVLFRWQLTWYLTINRHPILIGIREPLLKY